MLSDDKQNFDMNPDFGLILYVFEAILLELNINFALLNLLKHLKQQVQSKLTFHFNRIAINHRKTKRLNQFLTNIHSITIQR